MLDSVYFKKRGGKEMSIIEWNRVKSELSLSEIERRGGRSDRIRQKETRANLSRFALVLIDSIEIYRISSLLPDFTPLSLESTRFH